MISLYMIEKLEQSIIIEIKCCKCKQLKNLQDKKLIILRELKNNKNVPIILIK